jgi:hypothetical protein
MKRIFWLLIVISLLFVACPGSDRPTQVVKVCLESGQLEGEWCPAAAVVERKFYKNPNLGEPVAPTELCTTHKKPDDPIDPPDPLVQVEVCQESSLFPGEWCVDRKTIEVRKSALPLAACTVHKAPRIAVYVGVYDLLVAEGDWRAFLRKVKSAGGTGIRIFADCQWNWEGTRPFEYAAYDESTAERIRYKDPSDPKDIQNDGGTMVLVRESGRRFPLFDYTRPRAEYWGHLREVLEYCRDLRLTAWVAMLDFCTLKTPGDEKYFSAWYCAVQRMLPGIQNGTWGEQMKPWIAAFYRKVWDAIRESGVQYLIEDMNEGDALGWDDAFMLSWFNWSNAELKGMAIPHEKIVTTAARNVGKIAALCGIYSPHGIGRPEQIREYAGVPASKTIWSSDGYWGGTGVPDAKGRRGVGEDVAAAIAEKIYSFDALGFEYLPRGSYRIDNNRATVDDLAWAIVHAFARIR